LGCHLFLEMAPGHVLTQLAKEAVPSVQALALGETSLEHALRIVARYSN
jgi:malonate decarboxylase epsilon subunit